MSDQKLVKHLLEDLLDGIDYLSLYDQKYKVGTIANEINKQIKAEEDIKKIMELSRDIEQFFKQGGDYNKLASGVAAYEPTIYGSNGTLSGGALLHSTGANGTAASDSSHTTDGHIYLPDLDTGNSVVQQRVLSLLTVLMLQYIVHVLSKMPV